MPAEVFANLAESTLSVAALSTDTTGTFVAGAPFPAAGQYRLRLDDSLQQPNGIATRYELCRATFNAGNVVNLFRTGADLEGTTAQGWPIGTAVRAIVTAAALKTYTPGGPYKARAYRNAVFTLAAGSQQIQLDTKSYDPDVDFTVGASAHYTCFVAGYYQVNGRAGEAAVSGGRAIASIYKNGVECSTGADIANSTAGSSGSSVSDVVLCAAGDTLSLWIYCGAAAALSIGSAGCYLSVHYLSS